MITKKLKNQTFAWDQQAFNGKGYWFVLGKNGGLGLAASKAQAKRLGQPKDQVKQGDDKEVTPKVISEKTKNVIPKQKAKLKNIANTKRKSNKSGQSDEDDKVSDVKSSGKKVGNLDTALYTAVGEDQKQRLMKGDGLANIATKLVNFYKQTQEEKKLQRELNRNFAKEIHEQEMKRHEKEQKDLTKPKKEKPKLEKMSKIGKLEHPETAARLAGEEEELGFFGEIGASLSKAASGIILEFLPEILTILGAGAVGLTVYNNNNDGSGSNDGGVTAGITYKKIIESSHNSGYLVVETSDGQKVRIEGTRAWRNHNPGNLKGVPKGFGKYAIGKDADGHVIFDTYEHGVQAQHALLFVKDSERHNYSGMTVQKFVWTYLGSPDGKPTKDPDTGQMSNPQGYLQNIIKSVPGISPNTLMSDLSTEQQSKLEKVTYSNEGNKSGKAFVISNDGTKTPYKPPAPVTPVPSAPVIPTIPTSGKNLNKKSADIVSDKKNKNNNTQVMVNKSTNIVNNQSKNTKEIIIEEKRDDTPLILQAH